MAQAARGRWSGGIRLFRTLLGATIGTRGRYRNLIFGEGYSSFCVPATTSLCRTLLASRACTVSSHCIQPSFQSCHRLLQSSPLPKTPSPQQFPPKNASSMLQGVIAPDSNASLHHLGMRPGLALGPRPAARDPCMIVIGDESFAAAMFISERSNALPRRRV